MALFLFAMAVGVYYLLKILNLLLICAINKEFLSLITIICHCHLLIIWCKVMYNMYNIDGKVVVYVVCEAVSNIRLTFTYMITNDIYKSESILHYYEG